MELLRIGAVSYTHPDAADEEDSVNFWAWRVL